MSQLELAAAALTLASVILTVVEDHWCWPVGAAAVVYYAFFFWETRYYANMGLQAVFFVVQFYGWYEWLYGERGKELSVRRAGRRLAISLGVIGAVIAPALGAALATWTNAEGVYADAAITSFSLVAQWMLARKLLESWLFWIGVDAFAIAFFGANGHYPTATVYGILFVLAVLGYRQWAMSLRDPQPG